MLRFCAGSLYVPFRKMAGPGSGTLRIITGGRQYKRGELFQGDAKASDALAYDRSSVLDQYEGVGGLAQMRMDKGGLR
jgi:hypothetical protein